jgi:geranylgeranyl diphosphate synthase, type I
MTPEFLEQEKEVSVKLAQAFMDRFVEDNKSLNPSMRIMLSELRTYSLRGGKWHRPALARAVVSLLNKHITHEQSIASLSTEFIHRFILTHDDIFDQDLSRHGGPTIEKIYREKYRKRYPRREDQTYSMGMAMVGGDILHTLSYQVVTENNLPGKIQLNVIKGLNQELHDTAAGWLWETDLKQKDLSEVTEAAVMKAMTQVSAHYSVLWPLRIGQLLAGRAYGDWVPALEVYGEHVGLAFQIQDDMLAVFGDQKTTGKPVGNDIREGKKTLLNVYAYAHAGLRDRDILETSLSQPVSMTRLAQIRKIYEQTGAYAYAKNQSVHHAKKGMSALDRLTPAHEEAREKLMWLADFMYTRKA